MLAKGGRVYREFVFCVWMSWERVLPLFGVNKSIDNLQMSGRGLVKHSWLCIWALQCLPRGLCFCKPLQTPPELQRLREDLVYLSRSTAVCWPSPYSATLWSFGSCSHSAFRQPVVHPERGLSFFLFEATVFTLTITPRGSFGCWGVHFRLLPFPTYSSEHW